MAPEPLDAAPEMPTLLTVRTNRLRGVWVGAACFVPGLLLLAYFPTADGVFYSAVRGVLLGGLVGFGAAALILASRKQLLEFDSRTRTMRCFSSGKPHRIYPEAGFDRIEYRAANRRIYQTRADGSSRRVPANRFWANQHDWESLVQRLSESTMPRSR
ncbi:hypothetical protein [Glycomyces sp. NPDC048151]|uniref:hypothetical protein n=1 Tax=Glycomyces sp. NPDC048151 TaxID=3364002 RepID=UPI0037139DF0